MPRGITSFMLTHWGRVTHICVNKLTIIGSDNGLSPDRRQAIIWTNAGLLSIGPMRTYFSENLIKIHQFSLKKMHVKMSSAKWRPSCLGLNVLTLCMVNCLWFGVSWVYPYSLKLLNWHWGNLITAIIRLPQCHWTLKKIGQWLTIIIIYDAIEHWYCNHNKTKHMYILWNLIYMRCYACYMQWNPFITRSIYYI